MAISPTGSPFSNFLGSTAGLEKLGIPKDAFLAATAIAGIAGGLKGDPIGKLVETAARSIKTDPQTAAELARQITQLGAAVIRAGAKEQEANAANAQPFVEETTTTKRVEIGTDGVKKVKTTTTTVTEKTTDPKSEAAKARIAAQQLEQFGSGLVDGKINLGDETFTFSQVVNLVALISKFERNGRKEELKDISPEKPPVDINETGVVSPSPFQPSLDTFEKEATAIYPKTDTTSDAAKPSENVSFNSSGAGAKASDDLDAIAGLAKTILGSEQLTQLKQLASHLDDNQLATLIRKIVAS